MAKTQVNNLVNPVVSDVNNVNGNLLFQYANDGRKEIPSSDGIAEINDNITESDGYDKHELKETESDGTQNTVGSFYLGKNQITSIELVDDNILRFHLIDQAGTESTQDITLPK